MAAHLPLLDVVPGPVLARGREATLREVGTERVLRCYDDARDVRAEVAVMAHVAAHGVRVPRLHGLQVGPGGDVVGMVLERVDGPTLLEASLAGDVDPAQVGRVLARLHAQLHRVPLAGLALPGAPASARLGDVVVHLDLHPANVLVEPDGRCVVIDWSAARADAPGLDTAMTALTLAATAVAGVPAAAGDVAALMVPASWVLTVLSSFLAVRPTPLQGELERAADQLASVGAHPADALRAALDLVRAGP